MASRSRPLSEIVEAALKSSSIPRKHKKESRQDAAAPVAVKYQATTHKGHRKKVVPSGFSVNNGGDGEDAAALPANFQQGRRSDNAQAEQRTNFLTSDVESFSDSIQPQSQAETDQDTADTTESDDPPPKRKGGYHPSKPGARCDCCIVARKRCDGVRPVCGRCTSMDKNCEWHDGEISEEELNKMKEKVRADGARARKKTMKRAFEEMNSDGPIKRAPKPKPVLISEKDDDERKELREKRANHIATLKAKQEALKTARDRPDFVTDQSYQSTVRPTTADVEENEQATVPWGYEDHLDMLDTISQPRFNPATQAEVFGHKKGNKVPDDVTKALADFDALDDEDVDVDHTPMYSGLVLNWEESEDKRGMPNANLSDGAGLLSNVRARVGLPDYPVQRVEGFRPDDYPVQNDEGFLSHDYRVQNAEGFGLHDYPLPSVEDPDVQAAAMRLGSGLPEELDEDPMRLSTLGREDFGFMENWMNTQLGAAWDDGGRLPEPRETANFSGYDEPLNFDDFVDP
jgi:hypothetical protein